MHRFLGHAWLNRLRHLFQLPTAVRLTPVMLTMSNRIPRPLPLEGVIPDECGGWTTTAVSRDLDEDCQFLQASPVPRPCESRKDFYPAKAKRSLIFEPSPNYHHYYDILDDDTLLLRGDFSGKRERSSEEEENPTTAAGASATDLQRRDASGKAKQVKKRVKRIEQKNGGGAPETRRSLEIQEMLKAPNYQRPRRGAAAAECLAAATPCVVKARRTYRRPQRARHHSSSTYLGVEQPEPEEEEEEEGEAKEAKVGAGSESVPESPEAGNFRRGGSCRSGGFHFDSSRSTFVFGENVSSKDHYCSQCELQ